MQHHKYVTSLLKKIYPIHIYICILALLIVHNITNLHAVIIDRIVAIVNGEVITLSDLQEAELPFIKGKAVNPSSKKELQI